MRPSLALFAAVALASSGNAAAQTSAASGAPGLDQNYISFRGGAYMPRGDAIDQLPGYSFNTGFGGEVTLGRRFNPNFAVEAGIGTFAVATDDIPVTYDFYDAYGYYLGSVDGTRKGEVRATPILATVKGILPLQGFELYAGAGLGVYFVSAKETGTIPGYASDSHTYSDSPIGLHVGAGAMIPLAPNWKLSIEGRLVSVKASITDADGYNYDLNLGGTQLSGGLMFSF